MEKEEIKKLRDEYNSLKPITDERIRTTLNLDGLNYSKYPDEPNYANPYVQVFFVVKNLNFEPEKYVDGDGSMENKQKRYKCILEHTINYQPCILSAVTDINSRTFDTKYNFNKIKQFVLIAKNYGYEVVDIVLELNRKEEWEFYNEEEFFDKYNLQESIKAKQMKTEKNVIGGYEVSNKKVSIRDIKPGDIVVNANCMDFVCVTNVYINPTNEGNLRHTHIEYFVDAKDSLSGKARTSEMCASNFKYKLSFNEVAGDYSTTGHLEEIVFD